MRGWIAAVKFMVKDEILSRGIPVHWRSCVRNTLFCISGFKRTTPHFLVWAESAVNFQNNTDVFLAVQSVMAKSAVKNPQSPTTKTRLSSCSCLRSACLLVVYLQKISVTEGLLYFQEWGERTIFPIWSVPIFLHTSSVKREYKVLFSFNI